MRFVIMADGQGTRWNNYMGVPKHLALVDGEPVLGRTVRLLREVAAEAAAASGAASSDADPEIIITSHDARYEFEGARRHEPENNIYEIDRFTTELVCDDMCFLYGDTVYDREVLADIAASDAEDILFYGNRKSVVAVRIGDADLFRRHFDRVRNLYLDGKIEKCKGWQIYQSVTGQDLNEKPVIGEKFVVVDEHTTDINTPEEYKNI
ncbi:MAG: nucleotidyltransferase family protein [Firmicutes bacterium]|nr:nucleotidyltransferase family protein [Bacillota bacterium]